MNEVAATFLRTIPEDRSDDAASSSGFRLPPEVAANNNQQRKRSSPYEISSAHSEAASSTRVNLDNGGSPSSEVSSARGTVPSLQRQGGESFEQQQQQQQQQQTPKPSFWNKRKLTILLPSLILLSGVIVAIALVISQMSSGDEDDLPEGTTITSSPPLPTASTPPPEPEIDRAPIDYVDPEIEEELDSYLLEIVTSEDDLLNRSESSQYKARHWMLYDDLLRNDVLDEGASRVHQRFVMVQFYFATNGDQWTDKSSYLSPDTSECQWMRVKCKDDRIVVVQLNMTGNNLSGNLPEELSAGIPSLEELLLSNNAISGTVPSRWFEDDSTLNDFFNLDLSQNSLTGSIPEGLWGLPKIRFVYLNQNLLSGAIDASTSDVPTTTGTFLEDVWLHANRLEGDLPGWFGNAPNLLKWVAWGNQVSGSLPTVFPPKLSLFDMSGNAISGTLPSSLFSLPELEIVYLDGNRLSGPLPDPGNTTLPLRQVWLHNNTLSGAIPDEFGFYWPDLRKLLLHDNPALTGVLGQEGVEDCRASGLWKSLERLEADCVQARGGVVCDCCTNEKCL